MPRELVAIAPRQPVIREYDEPKLQPKQVRVQSAFSAPKHGTELASYRGISPFSAGRYDRDLCLFLPEESKRERRDEIERVYRGPEYPIEGF